MALQVAVMYAACMAISSAMLERVSSMRLLRMSVLHLSIATAVSCSGEHRRTSAATCLKVHLTATSCVTDISLCGNACCADVGSLAELAQQVGRVVRALSGAGLRVRSAVMTGGQSQADRRSKTFRTQVGCGRALMFQYCAASICHSSLATGSIAVCSLRSLDTTAAVSCD
jgi:hypothetical protein